MLRKAKQAERRTGRVLRCDPAAGRGKTPGRNTPRFYKAGFEAAHILEAQEQWKPAIAIYQKMAALEGPRSDEAKNRITDLRLKHFIWEE